MKTVFFDLYGTLVDIHTDETADSFWKAVSSFFSAHDAAYSADELKSVYEKEVASASKKKSASFQSYESNPEIEIEDVFAALYRKKGVEANQSLISETASFFRKASTEYIRLYPYVKELIAHLKDHGLRVVLLSNAQKIFTEEEMKQLGIFDQFDSIYISSAYGVKKPDPAFFRIALKQEQLKPEDVIMVGNDAICDIHGAHLAGIPSLYIHSNLSPDYSSLEAEYVLDQLDLKAAEKILLAAAGKQ